MLPISAVRLPPYAQCVNRELPQRVAAEFVGTFALVFVGAGAVMAGGEVVGIALAHGLILAVMISAVGHISGGHFNPAVTLGFLITGRMDPVMAVAYWVTQFAAATVAALLLWGTFPDQLIDAANLGAPSLLAPSSEFGEIAPVAGLVIEAVLTFFLVWVVFATAADPRGTFKSIAGLAIGFTIAADILIAGPFTGAAMNPARAFGPELVGNAWGDFWIWYVGPLVGGALGALAYEFLYLRPLGPEPVGPPETGLEEPRPGQTAAS